MILVVIMSGKAIAINANDLSRRPRTSLSISESWQYLCGVSLSYLRFQFWSDLGNRVILFIAFQRAISATGAASPRVC